MMLPISLTKTRGKKARVIGVDDHVSGVAAQRRQLGGAARGRQRKKKSALPLGVGKVQWRRERKKDGKRRRHVPRRKEATRRGTALKHAFDNAGYEGMRSHGMSVKRRIHRRKH